MILSVSVCNISTIIKQKILILIFAAIPKSSTVYLWNTMYKYYWVYMTVINLLKYHGIKKLSRNLLQLTSYSFSFKTFNLLKCLTNWFKIERDTYNHLSYLHVPLFYEKGYKFHKHQRLILLFDLDSRPLNTFSSWRRSIHNVHPSTIAHPDCIVLVRNPTKAEICVRTSNTDSFHVGLGQDLSFVLKLLEFIQTIRL